MATKTLFRLFNQPYLLKLVGQGFGVQEDILADIDGGKSSTVTFNDIIDGGIASTSLFDTAVDGGIS